MKLSSRAVAYAVVLNELSSDITVSGYPSRQIGPDSRARRGRLSRWLPAIVGMALGASTALLVEGSGKETSGHETHPPAPSATDAPVPTLATAPSTRE
jgi:hypothetical protein